MKRNIARICVYATVSLLWIFSGFGCFVYVREIFRSAGQSDRSLLFWYLPFPMIGIASGVLGFAILVWWRQRNR